MIDRKRPTPKIAEKPIIVYKALNSSGHGSYYKLRINGSVEKWTPGYHYTEEDFDKCGEISTFNSHRFNVEGNAFHVGKTMDAAYYHKDHNGKIVKMIIPKGAKYYENDDEYACSDLVYPEQDKIKEYLN